LKVICSGIYFGDYKEIEAREVNECFIYSTYWNWRLCIYHTIRITKEKHLF